jgi:hypothetical protein
MNPEAWPFRPRAGTAENSARPAGKIGEWFDLFGRGPLLSMLVPPDGAEVVRAFHLFRLGAVAAIEVLAPFCKSGGTPVRFLLQGLQAERGECYSEMADFLTAAAAEVRRRKAVAAQTSEAAPPALYVPEGEG